MGKTVNIEISEGKYEALQEIARKSHTSISGMIEKFLEGILPEERLPADPIHHLRGILKGGHSLTQELLRERRTDDAKHENHCS